MKIAVTGATGFIGRHVVRELNKHSVDVVSIGRQPLKQQTTKSGLRHVILDLSNYPASPYQYLGKPDVLIHLAWSALDDFTSPQHTEQELPLHEAFLSDMIRAGLRSLLVAGTCLEYGMQPGELSETAATQPVTAYGKAKDTLRQRLQRLQKEHAFKLCWSRLFYLYGEGQASNSLLPQLRQAVESNAKVFNMSEGNQVRDYLPVERLAALITTLALINEDTGIVNVCSGKPISVMQQVQYWLDTYNWSIELNPGYYPYPDYEPMTFWGNRSKLDKILERSS